MQSSLKSSPDQNQSISNLASSLPPNDHLTSSLRPSPLTLNQFSPLGSPLPGLRTSDHDPPSTFSPSDSFSLQHSHSSPLKPFNSNHYDNPSSSLQPAPLPVPKRIHPVTNIWAQPVGTNASSSSCAGSDLDLSSPLLGHLPMIRRFSHLSTTQPHSQSLSGSPASIPDPIGPISLGTDRYRGSLTSSSPLSAGFGPNSLPSNFYQPWYDSNSSAEALLTNHERIGRSKARDILGSRPPGSYRDPSVGSIGSPCSSSARSGIGLSNMSPFTGTSLLPPGGFSIGGSLANHNAEITYRAHRGRDSSLGAIGSGRTTSRGSIPSTGPIGSGLGLARSGSRMLNRGSDHVFVGSVGTDSWLIGGRSLSNDLDENDELAQPTKSGATSRRHSVSAFTGRGLLQGFESLHSCPNPITSTLSGDNKKMNGDPNETFPPNSSIQVSNFKDGHKNDRIDMFGRGSSALTDEDLCFTTDFNSLNLNLETQANQDRNERFSFQLSHPNNLQSSLLSFPPKSNYSEPKHSSAAPLNNMPWSSLSSSSQEPTSTHSPFGGPANVARKSSYSAGDPFSASAQASRYFAQHSIGSRIPFGHSGSNLQPLSTISSPSVTTFSASGQLSAPLPHTRQMLNPEAEIKQTSAMGSISTFAFDPPSASSFYPAPNSNSHFSAPLSPIFQMPSGLSGPSPTTQFNNTNIMMASPRSGTTHLLGANELNDLGKGIPLHQMPRHCRLYIVEFKGGRTDLFYLSNQAKESGEKVQTGDLVIVEADRGQDLGKVVHDQISIDEVRKFQNQHVEMASDQITFPAQSAITDNGILGSQAGTGVNLAGDVNLQAASNLSNVSRLNKEIHPKKIFGKASQADIQSILQKTEEEIKALSLCRSKALQRGLQMEITSAEWQWDRRKLTFFFIADKRIDFRDLVKDLFRTWKTRIWMCSVNP